MKNPRKIALKILLKIEQEGAYSNIELNNSLKEAELTGKDAGFCSALVYGVLERKILLDYIIRQYTTIRLKKIEVPVLNILRLGFLQLLFMDKVPESAAVNESVKLAKSMKLQKASGFINAVMRNFVRAGCKYKLPDKSNSVAYYSVLYSTPESIVKLWLKSYGEENTVKILENQSGRPPIAIRVNTLKTTAEELKKSFEDSGITAEYTGVDNALFVSATGAIENTVQYRQGLFHVQDIASQLCCSALAPKPDMLVYDFCSAPGGKAFTMAQLMENKGELKAFDMYEHKVKLINNGAYRLGIKNINAQLRNALSNDSLPQADRVLCDVPCSGLGIIRRKPEIKYKEDLGLDTLPQLQYDILCNCSRYVKSGGMLVYSTCTLNPAENEENVKKFLTEHSEFQPLKIALKDDIINVISATENTVTLAPQKNGSDGFFISLFVRK